MPLIGTTLLTKYSSTLNSVARWHRKHDGRDGYTSQQTIGSEGDGRYVFGSGRNIFGEYRGIASGDEFPSPNHVFCPAMLENEEDDIVKLPLQNQHVVCFGL